MKNFQLLIIALALVTFFSACKKDDAPKVVTTADKISSEAGKRWTISSMRAKFTLNGQQQEQDVKNLFFPQECQRDNVMVLYKSKKYETREGTLKCGNDDLVSSGTWELKSNDTELHVTVGSNQTYSTLKDVSETSVTTEFPQTFPLTSGGTVDATVTVVYTAL